MNQFFLEWLPEQLRRLDVSVAVPVTVLVLVGETPFTVSADSKQVEVSSEATPTPTFRVVMTEATFERLVLPAQATSLERTPALKMLSLDAETIDLVAGVPGCLELRVVDGEQVLSVVFGPGEKKEVGCTVQCSYSDLRDIQAGAVQPLELLMSGKLQLDGDPQIAMALGGLLM